MNTLQFLLKLKELKIEISLSDGRLKINAPEGILTSQLKNEISSRKEAIVDFLISAQKKYAFSEINVVEERSHYGLSSAQRRLWILSQFEEGNVAYNIPSFYTFHGSLDRAAFDRTFRTLVERHESLRTTFIIVEGDPKQKIHSYEELGFSVEYIDLRGDSDAGSKVSQLVKSEGVKAFDLECGPLLRAGLIQLGDEDYVFMFTLHHIISDGWSMEVLVREVLHLYACYSRGEAHSLRPLRIQYKDYASWQNQQLTGDGLKDHRGYWHNRLSGELPVLDFPSDYARPSVKTYAGSSVGVGAG